MKKYLFLIIALLYTFSYTFWYRVADGFFFLNRSEIYEKNVMEIGSLWLLNVWTSFVGFNILSANIFAWLLCIGALMIPYIALQTSEEQKKNIGYLSTGVFLMGCFTFNLYNPDAPSLFFLICLSTLLLRSVIIGKYKIVLLGGIITGILISMRFPNVVALPMVAVYLLFKQDSASEKLKLSFGYTIISLIAYVIIVCLLSGRWDFVNYYISSIKESMYLADEEHGLYTLLHSYIFSLIPIAKKTIVLMCIILLSYKFKMFKKWYLGTLTFVCIAVLLYLWDGTKAVDGFRETYGGCTLALLSVISIFNRNDKKVLMSNLLLGGFMFVGAAGSDTGLMKIYFFAVVASMLVMMKYDVFRKYRSECIYVISPLVLFSIYSFSAVFFEKHKYESFSNIPNIVQFVNEAENIEIQRQYQICKKYADKELYLYGHPAHYVYVALEKQPPYLMPFYMKPKDEKLIQLAFDKMDDCKNCVMVDFTNSEILKQKALEKGLKVSSMENYNVYE